MKNPVAERIAGFLKQFPPFSSIANDELDVITQQSRILYLEKNQVLFKGGDALHSDFYVVKDGAVGLSLTSDTEETLIDKCDEGDILGLRPFFAKNNYLMTARAREEAMVIAIPIAGFQPYVAHNPAVLGFLLESFASQSRNPHDKIRSGKLISENTIYNDQAVDLQYFQPIRYSRNPITANPDDILKFVAKSMANSAIGSVIVQEDQLPKGIITDWDLRAKIATGMYPIDVAVREIMTTPVITVPENISVAEAQIMMLKHNVGHLCVTRDGSDRTAVSGIISEHDVIAAQANTPGVLLKQTRRAANAKELKHVREKLTDLIQNSIDKNVPVPHIANIAAEINIAITRRAIELSVENIGTPPPARFVWMNIGSQGRKEQLLLTDQSNAIIFEDVPAERHDTVKRYFIELAELVTEKLNKVGYEDSAHRFNADNPKWCNSLSDWIKQYSSWINNPEEKGVEVSNVFFDFDFIYGVPAIEDVLIEHIRANALRNKKFLAYLAADALKNPAPLGFFRQFLVESDGEHKDAFNIKNRGLEPLIDAARLLAINLDLVETTNTYARFKKLAETEPKFAELYEECAEAFNTLTRFRTEEGLLNSSNGNYLNLNDLSKSDKVKLKNCFQPINDLQDMLKNRFSLTYIK